MRPMNYYFSRPIRSGARKNKNAARFPFCTDCVTANKTYKSYCLHRRCAPWKKKKKTYPKKSIILRIRFRNVNGRINSGRPDPSRPGNFSGRLKFISITFIVFTESYNISAAARGTRIRQNHHVLQPLS